jgi:PIN domain nuclease of toxin-antitoxin system
MSIKPTLLWWLENNPRLKDKVRQLITIPKNTIYISSVTIWEVNLKRSLGKLEISDNFEEKLVLSYFTPLPLTHEHSLASKSLPWHHRDPFDRMLIVQAQVHNLTLVTHARFFITADGSLVLC